MEIGNDEPFLLEELCPVWHRFLKLCTIRDSTNQCETSHWQWIWAISPASLPFLFLLVGVVFSRVSEGNSTARMGSAIAAENFSPNIHREKLHEDCSIPCGLEMQFCVSWGYHPVFTCLEFINVKTWLWCMEMWFFLSAQFKFSNIHTDLLILPKSWLDRGVLEGAKIQLCFS